MEPVARIPRPPTWRHCLTLIRESIHADHHEHRPAGRRYSRQTGPSGRGERRPDRGVVDQIRRWMAVPQPVDT
ncbi:hypothetical protein BWQ95_21590, partial [Aeromonas hydrophila]